MKFFYDFFPLIIFFSWYQYSKDLIAATGILIVAQSLQVAYTWITKKKVEKMHLVTLALVLVFGGATVLLHDATFIKWKPTVINWLFAGAFLFSEFIGEKSLIRRMLDENIQLPDPIWRKLNLGWIIFFVVSGVLNIYVAFNYPQDTWVNFKVFGLLGLTLIFVVLQGIYLARYIEDDDDQPVPGPSSNESHHQD